MTFGTSDRTSLWVIPEVTWGVTPGSGNITALRLISESLSGNLETKVSEEIISDRTTADVTPVGQDAGGTIEYEMSFGAFDDLIGSALFSSFSADVAIVAVAGDISTVNATGKITSTTAGKFTGLVLGQSFRLKGFTTNSGENNLIYKIITYTSDQDITVLPAPPSDETPAGTDAEIHGQTITNGVAQSSFTMERRIPNTTVPEYFAFAGCIVSSMTMDYEVGALLKGNFEILSKDENQSQTALAGLTDVPAATEDVYNSVSNLSNIFIDNAVSSQSYLKLGMTINNNLRGDKAIGSLANVNVGDGSIDLTGPIEIYFADGGEFAKFKNNTEFSLSFSIEDAAGNAYVFSFPKAKYENLTMPIEGKNNTLKATGSWRALKDSTELIMIRIDKLDASL